MANATRAGIELNGAVVRYAALSGRDDALELLRLGRCDFDFDVADLFRSEEPGDRLDDVAGALGDVFSGLDTSHLYVALPPECGVQFFAPVDRGTPPPDRNEALHWQARRLRGASETPFKMVVSGLDGRDEAEREWYHVLAVDRPAFERFTKVADSVGAGLRPRFRGTVRAGYEIGARLGRQVPPEEEADVHLLVGAYERRRELTLCEDGKWIATTLAREADREEEAFYAARLLQAVDRSAGDVAGVFLYGPDADEVERGELAEIFSEERERLDPFRAINIDAGDIPEGFAHWEYVPALGVIL